MTVPVRSLQARLPASVCQLELSDDIVLLAEAPGRAGVMHATVTHYFHDGVVPTALLK